MKRRKIVCVGYDGITALDLVGPMDVFDSAGRVAAGDARRNAAYELVVASPGGAPFRTTSGLTVQPDRALERLRGPLDTLLVAGGYGSRRAAADPTVVGAVRRLAGRARRVVSVCTGAFVLGAAGLLEDRRATTHWAACDELAARFACTAVEPDPIFVRSGDVWTSAGVTAGMDLCLALVEDDLGREVALRTARYLVLYVHRTGGQSQFSELLGTQLAERDPLRELQSWILEHADEDLSVPRLARRAGMSPRHFARVFKDEVGETPAAWVERARVEIARRLLETTALPVERVGEAAGFGSPPTFRRVFRRRLGVGPRAYRARFAA